MAVTFGSTMLAQYRRFSLYNSPYVSHRGGCAIDLYPDSQTAAPSPVAGDVLETRTVDAPPKPYAVDHDHLIVLDAGEDVARVLHVNPAVEPGDAVDVGDSLGRMVRSGFFAPWVDNHLHLGFREHGTDYRRASGSLPIRVDVPVEPLSWDGTGTVVETDDTYAVLDSPTHPDPGKRFAGVAAGLIGSRDRRAVLDGGLPHYDGGGLLAADGSAPAVATETDVTLAGHRVGTVAGDGRTVEWADATVLANDREITGLSLFCARDAAFGAKLVCPDVDFAVGEDVTVTVERSVR
ncbi:MAG: hypothetical protein ABEI96_06840 [Haloarculaceae archaeon]